jgi:hypothetical protein
MLMSLFLRTERKASSADPFTEGYSRDGSLPRLLASASHCRGWEIISGDATKATMAHGKLASVIAAHGKPSGFQVTGVPALRYLLASMWHGRWPSLISARTSFVSLPRDSPTSSDFSSTSRHVAAPDFESELLSLVQSSKGRLEALLALPALPWFAQLIVRLCEATS